MYGTGPKGSPRNDAANYVYLPPRVAYILLHRALGGGWGQREVKTLERLAEELGISRERVRQLEAAGTRYVAYHARRAMPPKTLER